MSAPYPRNPLTEGTYRPAEAHDYTPLIEKQAAVVDALRLVRKHMNNPHPSGLVADQRRLKASWDRVWKALDAALETPEKENQE